MENIWAFLMQTLTASVAAVLLLIAKRLFLDKLSPRWQYGVWAILALRVLLPAGLLGRFLLPEGRMVLETTKLTVEANLSSTLTPPYTVTEVAAPIPLLRPVLPTSVTDWLFYLYAAGVILTLLWFLLTYAALRRKVVRGRTPAPEVTAQLERVAKEYGLKVPRRVVVMTEAESAFVCGPLSPVLVLPERAVDDKVLLHELLHLKYGDLWAGVGICLLRCLHWCNPLLWYCWNRAQNDSEALCDQRVLERLEGEQRREYGVILLSMAEDKYARAPGTTSMANGGRNIKDRIGAIARFKRYPRGVALGAGCVAVVLAVTCLTGTGGAVAVPEYDRRGSFAMTAALLNRPTTVAGALDTYAKAVLCNSSVYFAMVAPEEERTQAIQAVGEPFEEVDLYASPFSDLGYCWTRPAWQAEWSVMNLLPDGAGGYTGTLFFVPLEGDETKGVAVQQVAVRPEGEFWTVIPLGELESWVGFAETGVPRWLPLNLKTPGITYVGETDRLRIEVDLRMQLGIDRTVSTYRPELVGYLSGGWVEPAPRPSTPFTLMQDGFVLRVTEKQTGAAVEVPVELAFMSRSDDPERALSQPTYRYTLYPVGPDDYQVRESTGSCGGSDMTLTAMPEALAVAVEDREETYICVALPEEVVP
ncbi:MAG: M56 family metallopeptidase [Clostridiales bacterium]|uniref:M56 family metallopeptidase n=1 Tax=Flavonifractor porci TaxID=3133422 RepID=UPI0030B09CB9|nr:M56 family metallopeptidase [Clostridiales bacterium]